MTRQTFADHLRRLLICWLSAALLEYLLLQGELRSLADLSGVASMSFPRMALFTGALFPALWFLGRYPTRQRWALSILTGLLYAAALLASFTWPLLGAGVILMGLLLVYARYGWDDSPTPAPAPGSKPLWGWITFGLSIAFFLFVSAWGVGRVYSFCAPTYDMGIFSQMFHSMKTTGLPITTLEREGALSHFAVHVSPIYYLMLPLYCLFPFPATLQIQQAAVLTSAVIPLWLLGKRHGLSGANRLLLCLLLLLYPAFSGGTGYDLHENCFLTPLLLWLLWALDWEKPLPALLFGTAVLLVKEDAAVYTAVVGLWETVRRLLKKKNPWLGLTLFGLSVLWFLLVTGYLAKHGDGVMTYRYDNFIYDGTGSLLTVVKTVLLCPMKVLYESLDPEKLTFLALTLLPLLGLPLLTRRFERYILLIPYILVNLMPDYVYQHDIFFQYTFGSTALLLYLTCVNLADLRWNLPLLLCAGAVSLGCFCSKIIPKAVSYPSAAISGYAGYSQLRQALDAIPPASSVTASTFYTTHLSRRAVLYDLDYCSQAQLLSTDYIVFSPGSAPEAYGGPEGFPAYLTTKGYTLHTRVDDRLVIFERKP